MNPLDSDAPLIVYLDFKSPYAFMAVAPTRALEEELGIEAEWRPLTLDIPSFLGSARTDTTGKVVESRRSGSQWAAVRYAYADTKRYARLRGVTLLGPQKIWDSSLASIGLLFARRQGREVLREYVDRTFESFWKRELDIEDPQVIAQMLRSAGASDAGFNAFLNGEGRSEHDALQTQLHPAGIFGVPTYVVAGQVFFGREHLPIVRWLLTGRAGSAPEMAYGEFS